MKFWRDNKIANEYDEPVADVCGQFIEAVKSDPDLRERVENMRMERVIRSWLSVSHGSWVDETGPESFSQLYDLVLRNFYKTQAKPAAKQVRITAEIDRSQPTTHEYTDTDYSANHVS